MQVTRGIYVHAWAAAPPVVALTRARAALLTHPASAVVSHGSAARVLGAPVPGEPVEHVTVANAHERRRRNGVHCHVAALDAHDIEVVNGIRVTAPHRLFLDLASGLGLVDLVVVGDWLVSTG